MRGTTLLWTTVFSITLGCGVAHGEVFEVKGFADKLKGDDGKAKTAKVEPQHQSQWCWAASIQAVLANGGIKRTQEEIVTQVYGTTVNLPAGNPQQLYAALNNARPDPEGEMQYVSSRYYLGSPSATFLKEEISGDRPVILWYINQSGQGGHSVVAFKIDYTEGGGGAVVNWVEYFDPWPGKGIQRATRMELAPRVATYFSVHVSAAKAGDPASSRTNGAGSEVEHGERAREIAHLLFEDKIEDVRKDLSKEALENPALSADAIRRAMSLARGSLGPIKSHGEPTTKTTKDDLTAYDVMCKCQDGHVVVRVVYDSDEKIAGLWLNPPP